MKNILLVFAASFVLCSCKHDDTLALQSPDKTEISSNNPGILVSNDFPTAYPPFVKQDLYISSGYLDVDYGAASNVAISATTGIGYYYNNNERPSLAMASTGGFIYSIVQYGNSSIPFARLKRFNPISGDYGELGPTEWVNLDAMTAWGSLYAVQGGTLWKVNPSNGLRTPFSAYPTGWDGTEAMTALDNFLYAVQGGTLWRVNLVNGSVSSYSAYPAGWEGTEAMAATNGGIFAVQGGTLWKVSAINGSVAPFSAYPEGWGGTKAMAAKNGFLYIVQGGVMWKVSTFNGSVQQLGSFPWNLVTAMTALN
jgi:hypothetical protein